MQGWRDSARLGSDCSEPGSFHVLARVGDAYNSLILLTVMAAFGPNDAKNTLSSTRLVLWDGNNQLKAGHVFRIRRLRPTLHSSRNVGPQLCPAFIRQRVLLIPSLEKRHPLNEPVKLLEVLFLMAAALALVAAASALMLEQILPEASRLTPRPRSVQPQPEESF